MSDTPDQRAVVTEMPWHQAAIQQFLEVFITPYIEKRQAEGSLPKPFKLTCARAIFFPDGQQTLIQVNEGIVARFKIKESKKSGEPVTEQEIDWSCPPELPPEYKNCGHMTLIQLGDHGYFFFDFHYNKAVTKNLIIMAKQFYETAEFNLSKKNWPPFVDNLFSSAELAVKCIILSSIIIDRKKVDIARGHDLILKRFTEFADLGNVKTEHLEAYTTLRKERNAARYMKGREEIYTMEEKDAATLFEHVGQLIEQAEKFTKN